MSAHSGSFFYLEMFFNSESIFNAILFLTKLFGVFPYDHIRKKVSPLWSTYSLLIVSICTIEMAFIVFEPPLLAKHSLIRNILFRSQMLALYACIVIFNTCIMIHHKRVSSIFHILEMLRKETRGDPSFIIIVAYFLFQSVAITVTASFDLRGNFPLDTTVLVALSYYYGMISIIIVGTAPFVAVVQLISAKLEHLLSVLKPQRPPPKNRLYGYVVLYDRMVSLLISLNEAFNLQLLLISFVSFFNLTINMYFIADFVVNNSTTSRSRMIPVYLGWITMFSSLVVFPVYSCQRITKQAREFNTLLYQLMLDDKTNDISNNKKLRLHIAMKREVVFTACGFFTLDYTLVHSMIAAATTYLVILIQFGQPNGSLDGAAPNVTNINSTELTPLAKTPTT